MLALLGAVALTLAFMLSCRGLPPFGREPVNANEAVVFYYLLMGARWWLVSGALLRVDPTGTWPATLGRGGAIALLQVIHFVLGVVSVLVFTIWMSHMADGRRAMQWPAVAVCFALPILSIAYTAWLIRPAWRRSLPPAVIQPIALAALLALLAAAAAVFVARRREMATGADRDQAPIRAPAPLAEPPPGTPTGSPQPAMPAEDTDVGFDAAAAAVAARRALDLYLEGELAEAADVVASQLAVDAGTTSAATAMVDRRLDRRLASLGGGADGLSWSFCDELGDHARGTDAVRAVFLYRLAIAGYEWDRAAATGSGDASAASTSIHAVEGKLADLRRGGG